MTALFVALLASFRATICSRLELAAEILALRHQLAVLHDAETDFPDVEAAWAAEIEKRARGVLAGESPGVPWEDVRRRAEAELS